MNRKLILMALCTMLASPVGAQVLPSTKDSALPIEISADNLKVLQKDQLAVFEGKVEALQGTTRLTSDKMTVFYRSGEQKKSSGQPAVSKIIVEGNVFLANPRETARGGEGVYDVDKSVVTLSGDVELTRDKNILKGHKLVYNMDTGKSELFGGSGGGVEGTPAGGGRVKGMFVPNEKKN